MGEAKRVVDGRAKDGARKASRDDWPCKRASPALLTSIMSSAVGQRQ